VATALNGDRPLPGLTKDGRYVMSAFEYRITKHPSGEFKELVYFCTESGECTLNQVPGDQVQRLEDLLNAQGEKGWELVQVSFGRDGLLAFWKR